MIASSARGDWRELEDRLRPFVARRVGESDVDDVVQEIFVRMLRGLPGLRDDQRFGPWVYQIARSAIADQHRDRARHPVSGEQPPEQVAPDADESDGVVERALAGVVAGFVARLPSPYREALTLTELEGMTQREAAAQLGISVSGMKSRVQRGRRLLRGALEDCCAIALDARGRVIDCIPRPDGAVAPCCDAKPTAPARDTLDSWRGSKSAPG